jgi:hypothetical protein
MCTSGESLQADDTPLGPPPEGTIKRQRDMRRSTMPVHEIRLSLPRASVINADVEIEVWSDDAKLGELHLSKGTIDWRPAHAAREIRLPWERFARLMEEYAAG